MWIQWFPKSLFCIRKRALVFYGGICAFCLFTTPVSLIFGYESAVMTVIYALARLCDFNHFLMIAVWCGLTILTTKILAKQQKDKMHQFCTAQRKVSSSILIPAHLNKSGRGYIFSLTRRSWFYSNNICQAIVSKFKVFKSFIPLKLK